jgi:hypothetical protein
MFANVPTGRALITYNEETTKRVILMTDVSVYCFVRHSGPGGKELLPKRHATQGSIGYRPRPQTG